MTGGTGAWGEPARLNEPAPLRAAATPATAGRPAVTRLPVNAHRRIASPAFRITRATAGLIVIALGLGVALATGLGLVVYLITEAIHHAAGQ